MINECYLRDRTWFVSQLLAVPASLRQYGSTDTSNQEDNDINPVLSGLKPLLFFTIGLLSGFGFVETHSSPCLGEMTMIIAITVV